MSLGRGQRLGPYEIRGFLGAGGMGEVYQAHDTRLGRDVAIKIAAAEFSGRFEREARAIATFNHPNICALYDVGPNYLVMELVPGRTLAEVIDTTRSSAGTLPLGDVITIGRQIAEALEAAHERGIVHRDLKPANIKITPHGVAKVLDFGLAKALAQEAASGAPAATLTSTALTEEGLILGTARYMAPEQALGRPVDRRADIWAFGVVLFEMLTGRPVFLGETVPDIIAAVIKDDVGLQRLPPDTPPAMRRLLERCLERDPLQRLRDIGEARIVLSDPAASAPIVMSGPSGASARPRGSGLAWAVLTLALTGTAGATGWLLKPAAPVPLRRIELGQPLASSAGVALSPDGSRLAYIQDAHLYVRGFDALAPHDLGQFHVTSTLPFWSPDGRAIGFIGGGALHAVPAGGGAVRQVCRLPGSGQALDAEWLPDGTILFTVPWGGVYSVPAEGGTPTLRLATDPKTDVEFSSVSGLDDGRLIVTTFLRDSQTYRTDLVTAGPDPTRTTLIADPDVSVVKADRGGALLFRRRGPNQGVWAAPFDGAGVDLGRAAVIAPRGTVFQADTLGNAVIALLPPPQPTELVWMTERGEVTALAGPPVPGIVSYALSPDGRRVAFVVDAEGDRHLLVRDLETGSDSRLTPAGAEVPALQAPTWFPSSDEVVFATGVAAARHLVSRRLDGAGGLRRLVKARLGQVTPDGRHLVLIVDVSGQRRLRYAPIEADGTVGEVRRLLRGAEPQVEMFDVSPDGSTVAYTVTEADGRLNTFLTDFPAGTRQVQFTTRGGAHPKFSSDGKTIHFLTRALPETEVMRGALARRPVTLQPIAPSGAEFQIMHEERVPTGVTLYGFDLARDGRLLTIRSVGERSTQLRRVLVQNWRAAIGR